MEESPKTDQQDSSRRFDRRLLWIGLGLSALIIRFILSFSPGLTETLYSRGLFLGVRWLFDHTLTILPFPVFYLAAVFLLFGLIRWIVVSNRKNRGKSFGYRIGQFFLSLGGIIGAILFFFLFLWGFNYGRIPMEDQLSLHLEPLDSLAVLQELNWTLENTIESRYTLPGMDSTEAFEPQFDLQELELSIRESTSQLLDEIDYPTAGRVRGRVLRPKGILARFGTAGVYIPWIGEAHIDAGLHPLQYAYTMSHEMAHAFGVADEGSCNFVAFRACLLSADPRVQYSAWLAHLRYLLGEYRRHLEKKEEDRGAYAAFRKTLPLAIQLDMNAINQELEKYPDWVNGAFFNNLYLKTQGVSEGVQSYNRVVLMVKAWREQL
ncbi:MAG: DUF3810 family protein [Bacteroidota bacterium]